MRGLPRRALPQLAGLLRDREVAVGAVLEIAGAHARDRRRHRQHDRAERAGVVPTERRLGAVDDGPGLERIGCRDGSSCRRCAAAGAWRSSTRAPAAAPAAAAASPRARSPSATRTSARRCSECASPAGDPRSWCRSLASVSSAAASSRSPERSAASPINADANAAARSAPLRLAVVCRSRATLMTSAYGVGPYSMYSAGQR